MACLVSKKQFLFFYRFSIVCTHNMTMYSINSVVLKGHSKQIKLFAIIYKKLYTLTQST